MTDLEPGQAPHVEVGLLDNAYRIFLRLVAAGGLLAALRYWGGAIGYLDAGLGRFDVLDPHWQVAVACLSVLWPVAAVGLWMNASWGAVVWALAAGIEVGMHEVLGDLFGRRPTLVLLYGIAAGAYLVFRLALFIRDLRRPGTVRADLP